MNRSKAIINTKNIRHNLRIIREKSDTKIIGIVKANGYGTGINEISKVLRDEGVEMLGVPYVHEAQGLREEGDSGDILLTGTLFESEVNEVINLDLQVCTVNINVLKSLDQSAKSQNKKALLHIFVDTGMNREGVKLINLDDFISKLKTFENLKVVGCLTHLISSDDKDKTQTEKQIAQFTTALEKIEQAFGKLEYIHTHNSAAIFNDIKSPGNYSRPGIAIYGFLPTRELQENSNLRPSLKLVSEVTLVKQVKKGETVGYSNKYIAEKDITIALIPFGYGHGFPWALSNCGSFNIKNNPCKIVGSVCMDFTMVDITGLDISVGDEVIIMGDGINGDSIYDISEKANTIPYEIITHLLPRLDREYI